MRIRSPKTVNKVQGIEWSYVPGETTRVIFRASFMGGLVEATLCSSFEDTSVSFTDCLIEGIRYTYKASIAFTHSSDGIAFDKKVWMFVCSDNCQIIFDYSEDFEMVLHSVATLQSRVSPELYAFHYKYEKILALRKEIEEYRLKWLQAHTELVQLSKRQSYIQPVVDSKGFEMLSPKGGS